MKLVGAPRTALWVGSGAFLGLALGAVIVDVDTAFDYAPAWLLTVLLYVGGVLFFARRAAKDDEPARVLTPTSSSPRPHAGSGFALDFSFPDVPPGHPPVLGHNEPMHVKLAVRAHEGSGEGAAVRLTGQLRDGARFLAGEGVTGVDGTLTFTLRAPGVGELLLEAEVILRDERVTGKTSASIVRYGEEIERLFNEFRAYAHGVLGPDSRSDTARELAEKLRPGSDAQSARSLLELARIYELVAYGEREADRSLYLQLVGALLVLERGAPGGTHPTLAAGG